MSRTDKDAPDRRKAFPRASSPTPPRPFINHVWTSRQRQAVRVDCLNATKEYRADGQVDIAPTVRQHHHGAQWLWS
jgi:hypothetical protein